MSSLLDRYSPDQIRDLLSDATPGERADIEAALEAEKYDWAGIARPSQLPPDGNWFVWLILAGRGWGKLLDLGTPIPTPVGFVPIGRLVEGDRVFDENGETCSVTGVFDETPTEAWRLRFSDGTSLEAGGEHNWVTWTARDRKAYNRTLDGRAAHGPIPPRWPSWQARDRYGRPTGSGPGVKTTAQIVGSLTAGKRGDRNHSIPTTAPLTIPPVGQPLDPYVLGLWLGDGTTKQPDLTVGDEDRAHVEATLGELGLRWSCRRTRSCWNVRLLGCMDLFRSLDLLGHKHVPHAYLWASESQRLSLLRGLMDSDGSAEPAKVEFCNTDEGLARAALHLARSLGERPGFYKDTARLNGVDCGPRYRVVWQPARHNPFRLERKARRVSPPGAQASRRFHRMIVGADPIPVRPMRCISVNSESRMYLAGEGMIPTHNTLTGGEFAKQGCTQGLLRHDHMRWAFVAETFSDGRDTMIEGETGILSVLPPSSLRGGSTATAWNRSMGELFLANGSKVKLYSSEKPGALRGPQHHGCFPAGTLIRTPTGQTPIEALRVGDLVTTRQGPRPIGTTFVRNAEVAVLRHERGELTGTLDHPVWVEGRGWVSLGSIRPGAILSTWVDENGKSTRLATSTGTSRAARSSDTGKSGRQRTARSRQATTSIIGTSPQGTTIPPTSNSSHPANTDAFMQRRDHSRLRHVENVVPGSPISDSQRIVSTALVDANHGSLNADEPRRGASASIAGLSSRRDRAQGSVVSGVSISGLVTVVYNLQVEGVPEYFADGVLVHNCWGDEPAKWKDAHKGEGEDTTWSNLLLGLRLGDDPRCVMTTTPRPVALIKRLNASDSTVVTRGTTYENLVNLSPTFREYVISRYEGTRLGQQELMAQILDDYLGALWRREEIDEHRVIVEGTPEEIIAELGLRKIFIGVDPSTFSPETGTDPGTIAQGTETGIVVVGIDSKPRPHCYVLADLSCRETGETWARRVTEAFHYWKASAVVPEMNMAGPLVLSTLRLTDPTVTIYKDKHGKPGVRAAQGKRARAEPVATLAEQGRLHHVGTHGPLEDSLCGWDPQENWSPDRLDALVWAVTALEPWRGGRSATYGARNAQVQMIDLPKR